MDRLVGRRPVLEALRAGRPMRRILLADGARDVGVLGEIVARAREAGIRVDRVPRSALDRKAGDGTHQGVLAEVEAFRARPWQEGVAAARAAGRVPLVLALDHIEDEGNVGALLRSAEALGVDAVLLPERRSAGVSAAVAKAAAGAVEHLVIDRVSSLERALAVCREDGLWIVASASDGETDIRECGLLGEPVALVIGSESSGVSRLVRKRADATVRIPLSGTVSSLNASAAGALLMWEAARVRASG